MRHSVSIGLQRPSRHGVRRRRRITGLAVVLAIVGIAFWWTHPPEPVAALREKRQALVAVLRAPATDLGARVERWRVVGARCDTFAALWRGAPPDANGVAPAQRRWTVVLLGGLQTGDRAALLPPAELPANILALDWPWTGPRRMGAWRFLVSVPAIQRALLQSPAVLALGVDAAATQPEVDSTRIALVGASLGVPPAVAALRLTRTPRAGVLLHGAGDLRPLLRHVFAPYVHSRPLAAVAAALAYRLVRPLDPALHAGAVPALPMLLVNAREDERLPADAAAALKAAFPHAELRWQAGAHLRPRDHAAVDALATDVAAWLEAL